MAKILMINLPYTGHTSPTLGLAKELVERGHEVTYINAPEWRYEIEETGAFFIPYKQYPRRARPGQAKRMCIMAAYNTALKVGHGNDILIYEMLFFPGKVLAERLGIPCIRQFTTFAWSESSMRKLLRSAFFLVPFSRQAGKKALTKKIAKNLQLPYGNMIDEIIYHVPEMNIVYTVKEFQVFQEEFDKRFMFTGPPVCKRYGGDEIPYALMKEKIIYISLGTVLTNKRFLKKCIKAFQNEKVSLIISTGRKFSKSKLGRLPRNVFVFSYVPQLEVLSRASLFITHGGMNSLNEAMYYGVPMLAAPAGSDQFLNSSRLEELGIGKRIKASMIKPAKIREHSYELMESSSVRLELAKIQESMRKAGGIRRACDLVEREIILRRKC